MSVIEERDTDRTDRRMKIVSFLLHAAAIAGGIWFGITSFHWIAGG